MPDQPEQIFVLTATFAISPGGQVRLVPSAEQTEAEGDPLAPNGVARRPGRPAERRCPLDILAIVRTVRRATLQRLQSDLDGLYSDRTVAKYAAQLVRDGYLENDGKGYVEPQ